MMKRQRTAHSTISSKSAIPPAATSLPAFSSLSTQPRQAFLATTQGARMRRKILLSLVAFFVVAAGAMAANWSDTYLGFRTGNTYKETGNPDSIQKYILSFNHVSGYTYGQNFFAVDLMRSNSVDPANTESPGKSEGAQEAYLSYRH